MSNLVRQDFFSLKSDRRLTDFEPDKEQSLDIERRSEQIIFD